MAGEKEGVGVREKEEEGQVLGVGKDEEVAVFVTDGEPEGVFVEAPPPMLPTKLLGVGLAAEAVL